LPLPDGIASKWDPREIVVYENPPEDRDILTDMARPRFVISTKFRLLLAKLVPEQIQFLPIRLQSTDGKIEYPGFSLLNVLRVRALREANERSEEFEIFRVPFPCHVHVTGALKKAILSAGIRGVDFNETDFI
jgi:hypothetical protein